MAGSPAFPRLRTATAPQASQVQDNIGQQLQPVAKALAATPIMGSPPPSWIQPQLLADFANTGGTNAATAYHRDALGYTWLKGVLTTAAGQAAGTKMFQLNVGWRPSETVFFSVYSGVAAAQFISINPDGSVFNQITIGAGGTIGFTASFLAQN